MSMLSSQADELRETADKVDRLEAWERVSVPWMQGKLAPMLREAADTITSLSDKLQGVMGTRHNELFGTPERAARTLFAMCHGMRDCGFCPIGRAEGGNCTSCDGAETVLEWLRGDADSAEGGTVPETYIDGGESGSICPISRASVIFEGQKFTFDEEESERFVELVKGHLRKLAGLRGDAE